MDNNYVTPLIGKKTGLYKYPNDENYNIKIDPSYFIKFKIIVDTEEHKQQLLKASEYIHNLSCINSDYLAVNSIMHLYLNPELIEVKSDEFDK